MGEVSKSIDIKIHEAFALHWLKHKNKSFTKIQLAHDFYKDPTCT